MKDVDGVVIYGYILVINRNYLCWLGKKLKFLGNGKGGFMGMKVLLELLWFS